MLDYVVQTNPCCERLVLEQIQKAGGEAFLPVVNYEGHIGRKTYQTIEPLFPSYLFVKLNLKRQAWQRILGLRGVKRLLGSPTPIKREVMQELMQRYQSGFIAPPLLALHTNEEIVSFTEGDSVIVVNKSSPFFNHQGVCHISRGERVSVLLNLFGGEVEGVFNRADLAASI